MKTYSEISRFWALAGAGKSAALDANVKTGEILTRCTKSAAGDEGNGEPPIPYTDDWVRIVTCRRGVVTQQ